MKPPTKEKEVVDIDSSTYAGTLAYGYGVKEYAIIALTLHLKEELDHDFLRKVRVMKFKKDGEDYYSWAPTCECCGRKNNGVFSYIYGE